MALLHIWVSEQLLAALPYVWKKETSDICDRTYMASKALGFWSQAMKTFLTLTDTYSLQ